MPIRNLPIKPLKFDQIVKIQPHYPNILNIGYCVLGEKPLPIDQQEYFRSICKMPLCHYCQGTLKQRHYSAPEREISSFKCWYDICDDCGNWRFCANDSISAGYFVVPTSKCFDNREAIPALDELALAAKEDPERIYSMDPTRFEILVGSIIRNHMNCDVFHVGRTGDGGVDLIAVSGEHNCLIQVKRRSKSNAIEGLETVKLLFASAVLRNNQEAMVVTSAKDFTAGAKNISYEMKENFRSFDMSLIAMSQLMDMIEATRTHGDPPYLLHKNNDRNTTFAKQLSERLYEDGICVTSVEDGKLNYYVMLKNDLEHVTIYNVHNKISFDRQNLRDSIIILEENSHFKEIINLEHGLRRDNIPTNTAELLEKYAASIPESSVVVYEY